MAYKSSHYRCVNQEKKALCFCAIMLFLVSCSFFMALSNTGPIVLGTEMNTNGMVEYLCLGKDCNNIF